MIFNKNKTKWIPLSCWNGSFNTFILLGRRNLKNGMINFKVKNISRKIFGCEGYRAGHPDLDIKIQFNKLLEE